MPLRGHRTACHHLFASPSQGFAGGRFDFRSPAHIYHFVVILMICKNSVGRLWSIGIAALCCALFLMRPGSAAAGIAAGLERCAKSMIPALFPFLVISEFICQTGCAPLAALPFRPLCRLLRVSPAGGSAISMGMLGGFASGCSSISSLVKTNAITPDEARRLLCCCAGISPAFAISAVGYGMLGNSFVGWALFLGNWAACFFCGWLVSFRSDSPKLRDTNTQTALHTSIGNAFVASVNGAVAKMLTICGFVVIFALFAAVLAPENAPYKAALLLDLLLEISAGCRSAAAEPAGQLFFCTISMSLLGLCGWAQMRAILPDSVSLRTFLFTRPLHIALAYGVARLLLKLLPGDAVALTGLAAGERLVLASSLPWESALCLFAFLAVTCQAITSLRRNANPL